MFDFSYFAFRVERSLTCRSRLVRYFLDHIPRRSTFFDGKTRLLPGRTARLLRTWRIPPDLEHESQECFRAYRGGDFLDIGAFHGWYSLLLAPKAAADCAFISFEPDLRAAPDLFDNLAVASRIFPHVRFQMLTYPVGDGSNFAVAEFPSGAEQHPSYTVARDAAKNGRAIKTLSVDAVVKFYDLKPGFIKVDVEGAEYQVLSGMRETLEKFQPTVMLEIHPDWLPKEVKGIQAVYDVLISHGYERRHIDERHLLWDAGSK